MKKMLAVAPALVAFAGLLAACNSGYTNTLTHVVEEKTIVVGTEAGYAPFEYMDAQGNIKGFDIDVVELLVDQIEEDNNITINITWQDMDFDSLLLAVSAKQVDLVAAAMTITDERAEQVLFSDGYFDTKTSVVTLASSSLTSMDELKTVICGAQLGTTQADYIVEEGWNTSNSTHVIDKVADLTTQLVAGQIDALVVEEAVAENLVANYTATELKIVETIDFDDAASFGLAANKDTGSDLIAEINKALEEIGEAGLNQIYVDALEESTSSSTSNE